MTKIRWTDEGVAFHTSPGRWIASDPLDTPDLDAIVIRWPELRRIAAVEPWPTIEVDWQHGGVLDGTSFTAERADEVGFARAVAKLFDHLARHRPGVIIRGWLDVPDVAWDTIDAMPEESRGAAGPYRSTGSAERILARRTPSTWLETMAQFPLSLPWREIAGEVTVTTARVCVRRRDGQVRAIALDAFRLLRELPGGDLAAVFGRRAELHLSRRAECPVQAFFLARTAPNG